jgi:hypothetical protein
VAEEMKGSPSPPPRGSEAVASSLRQSSPRRRSTGRRALLRFPRPLMPRWPQTSTGGHLVTSSTYSTCQSCSARGIQSTAALVRWRHASTQITG